MDEPSPYEYIVEKREAGVYYDKFREAEKKGRTSYAWKEWYNYKKSRKCPPYEIPTITLRDIPHLEAGNNIQTHVKLDILVTVRSALECGCEEAGYYDVRSVKGSQSVDIRDTPKVEQFLNSDVGGEPGVIEK